MSDIKLTVDPEDLTPVQNRSGLWVKREDLHRHPSWGINGAKYRACDHLVRRAAEAGAQRLVSAQSVLSPQAAMGAVMADKYGLDCTVIVGGTTPEKAARHQSIGIAVAAGAEVEAIAVGYNPALQKAAKERVSMEPGAWALPYGITTPADATVEDLEAFMAVGGAQTANLPDEIETLVVPFGSGNTGVGVLYGLHDHRQANLKRVVLMGIGPNRLPWAEQRLRSVGRDMVPAGVDLSLQMLHPWFATYGDTMRESLDGIVLHPTYEGKVVRFLNQFEPEWWTRRDGTTALWIVGGPIGDVFE